MFELLRKYPVLCAGIAKLYPFQKAAIKSLLNGKNTLSIAPTGKGKSLIYQLASLELPGITIVVSPLTALIKEQVNFLRRSGINAIGLTSEVKFVDQRNLLRTFASKPPKLLFVSPERLQNSFFRAAILKSSLPISMIVVDEAHCVSQWGIDFRPEYAQISNFSSFLKSNELNPVTLALTATLGVTARNDIIDAYDINHDAIYIEKNTIRPELHLNFLEIDLEKEKDIKILELLKSSTFHKVIIYFYIKSKCNKTAIKLKDAGYNVAIFHSDMKAEEKNEVYEQYLRNEIKVLCATTAFGMGMNIPDIDMIIHYHIPNSIEEYYQQVGRAARDKAICPSADCYLLWSKRNFEYKLEEHIRPQVTTLAKINENFRKLGLENSAGQIKAIRYSNYAAQNLSQSRYIFENHGILKFLGEVYGSPESIVFKNENPYWDDIIKKMGFGNNFIRMAENSGLTLQELINYIFDEELSGRIKSFHVMEKKLFFISNFDEIPIEISYLIIKESKKVVEFKTSQLNALKEMIEGENPEEFISAYFN